MSLIPTWPFVAGALAAGAFGGAALDHVIMSAQIDRMELADAKSISAASQKALIDYQAAAAAINAAAIAAQADLAGINTKLAVIRREQKNAPPPPLPVDCKPGLVRLRNLAETAAAADRAIARPVPGQ